MTLSCTGLMDVMGCGVDQLLCLVQPSAASSLDLSMDFQLQSCGKILTRVPAVLGMDGEQLKHLRPRWEGCQ